ncbi:down syndrome cell adhesion molecule-like protein Dscam2 [Trichonephila clavata]|uniref:Down syndrome cell adhesion molecule-like protein Dscam2 n=1 Tax=Trichonephila clavata TaxID=2740835 RepID=A0A8X6J705_TRICU|nr:down syndrome cell adhesion molecule-like protein Dscam2 [Trichonephila clavata]
MLTVDIILEIEMVVLHFRLTSQRAFFVKGQFYSFQEKYATAFTYVDIKAFSHPAFKGFLLSIVYKRYIQIPSIRQRKNSSTESDNDDIMYAVHSSDDRIFRDEARESETECDRLWKTYESCQYEDTKRWKAEHTVLS